MMSNKQGAHPPLRVLVWGTYDLGKPRVRLLLRGLQTVGVEVIQCHTDVWRGVEDKSQLLGVTAKLRFSIRWLASYPALIWRYLRTPQHDIVLIGYMGLLDVIVLWPFAKLRGKRLVLDAFLSIYNTVIEDRKLIGPHHILARLLWFLEWLACHAADRLITDTTAHGQYFIDTYHLIPTKIGRVFVGVEPEIFAPIPSEPKASRKSANVFDVLFYGQFIPLHGIETIVRAASLCGSGNIRWRLIGKGQESNRIQSLIDELQPDNLIWTNWVPYENLIQYIQQADVCLGIFGTTDKAARVIPNKVFQILAAGKPLITADTPAIRELLKPQEAVYFVQAGNASALCEAVIVMRNKIINNRNKVTLSPSFSGIMPQDIGRSLKVELLIAYS